MPRLFLRCCLSLLMMVVSVVMLSDKAVAESRTWTDSTGQFTVEAQLLQFDGKNVQLKKADGRIVTLPLEKLCKADQELLEQQREAENPFSGGQLEENSVESITGTTMVRKGDYQSAPMIPIDGPAPPWSYSPQPVKESGSAQKPAQAFALPALRDSGSVEVKGFAVGDQWVVSCRKSRIYTPGAAFEDRFELDIHDRLSGETKSYPIDFPATLFGLSPDGKRLLLRHEHDRSLSGDKDQLDIFEIGKGAPKIVFSWTPLADKERYHCDIDNALWIDDRHVMSISEDQAYLWDVSNAKAKYILPIRRNARPVLSPDGQVLAVGTDAGISLHDALSGKLIARPWSGRAISVQLDFSPDGSKLAARLDNKTLNIWDMTSGDSINEIRLSYPGYQPVCFWTDDQHLMVPGRIGGTLYDTASGIPICDYQGDLSGACVRHGRVWHLNMSRYSQHQQAWLVPTVLPHESARDALKMSKSSDAFLVRPGTKIGLDIDFGKYGDSDEIRKQLEQRLEELDMVVDDQSPVKLVARIEAGEPVEQTYTTRQGYLPGLPIPRFGSPFSRGSGGLKIEVTPYKHTLSIVSQGETYWETKRESFGPSSVAIETDESIEETVRKNNKPDLDFFKFAWLPTYVSKTQQGGALMSARLGTSGVEPLTP